ncbi:MAG: alpha/beta fold hydrolase [Alphaproteobacteria bacterium]
MKVETTPVRFGAGLVGEPAVYFELVAPIAETAKPAIVMIHGGTQTGACYLRTADGRAGWAFAFAKQGYPVILPDWPGCGRSGAVPDSALDGAIVCKGLGAVIEAQAPVILMTHSMSGAYGWRLLEAHGQHIRKVVAIAPGPPGNIQDQPQVIAESADAIELQSLELRFNLDKRAHYRAPMGFIEKKIVGDGSRFPRDHVAGMAAAMDTLAPRLIYERLNVHGAQLRIKNFENYRNKPILLVTGSHDIDHPRALDAATADWLRAQGANAEFWYLPEMGIEGNGHMMMMEDNSDDLAALIGGWLGAGARQRAV